MKFFKRKIILTVSVISLAFTLISIDYIDPNVELSNRIRQLENENQQLNDKLQSIRDYLSAENSGKHCEYNDSVSKDITTLYTLQKEQMLKIPITQPIAYEDLLWISSWYGIRKHPIFKKNMMHYGIDYVAKKNTPVYATAPGIVVRVVKRKYGYGNTVVIKHGDVYMTMYAHLNAITVHKNDTVQRNQIIGTVGTTGLSTGPHLHYEVHKNGKTINPMDVIIIYENI